MPKPIITRARLTVDAAGQSIGRIASRAATALQGKHKAVYSPNQDQGDHVEIRNAAQVKVTGKKLEQKEYFDYSGYPGGMKSTQLKAVLAKNAAKAIERAVYNMLPKNRLRKERMKRLKVHND